MDIEPYSALITSQHRTKPRYMAWVRFLVSLFDVDIGRQMAGLFDAHAAKGRQLDVIGELVGVGRDFLPLHAIPDQQLGFTDDTYRRVILSKIVRNHFKGQQGSLQNLWEAVFETDILAVFKDNQDMTMDVDLIGDYTPLDVLLVLGGYIVPKPLGVGMKVNMATAIQSETVWAGSAAQASTATIGLLILADDPKPAGMWLHAASIMNSAAGITHIGMKQFDAMPSSACLLSGTILGAHSASISIPSA